MEIFGNSAKNGGGVAVLNGEFILDGGAVGVESSVEPDVKSGEESDAESETPVEDEKYNKATEKGGGVYVKAEGTTTGEGTVAKTSATVKSGNIWYNSAKQGGGIYLDKGEGIFTMEGENASVSHNTATEGGGIYLYKDPNLNQGKIEQNTADENGGGMYISDCLVTLNPTCLLYTYEGAPDGKTTYSKEFALQGKQEKPWGRSGSVCGVSCAACVPDWRGHRQISADVYKRQSLSRLSGRTAHWKR